MNKNEKKYLGIKGLTLNPPSYLIRIFTHLKLWLATATHNSKWVKTTHICVILDKVFANFDA